MSELKIGIISDIHSNVIAFETVIQYLESENCDEYILLGDYVSDTPYTRETLDLLYDFINRHTCHLLRGNREEYMLTQQDVLKNNIAEQKWIKNSASGNLLYTYEQLTQKDLEFFEKLPITFLYEKDGFPGITCCHGSPKNARELLELYGDNTKEWLEKINTEYMICAHTHFPGELEWKGKHYYNSGCVGISIYDYGYAQCMILQDKEENGKKIWNPTFLKVPYDYKKVVEDMYQRGMLDYAPWFINSNIQTLLTGEDNSAKMVNLATKLSKEAGEKSVWPLMKDIYFEEAAKKLGIPDYRLDKKQEALE